MLWECLDCTTKYAPGAPRCPHCRSEEWKEHGEMPKITVHGGPTNRRADEENATTSGVETEGGEDVSPGNSSPPSSETPSKNGDDSSTSRQSPARTTEPPSEPGQTDSSTARTTAGDRKGRRQPGSGN